MVFITHNPHHAHPVGDRFVILRRGEVLGDYGATGHRLDQLAGDDGRRGRAGRPGARAGPMTAPAFDVLTMGRVSVDLYPEQSGATLAEVRTFAKSLGGSPTNVAVAAARLGRSAAVITRVGDDGFGPYVRSALRGFGVDDRFVGTDPELRTPVVFCELHPPDRFPLLFYRQPTAPDIRPAPRPAGSRRDPARACVLDHRHRPVRRAQPHRDPRRARGPGPSRPYDPRSRFPAVALGRARTRRPPTSAARSGRRRSRSATWRKPRWRWVTARRRSWLDGCWSSVPSWPS